jgi:hypothetical protein
MKVAACTQERAGCHIHAFRTVAATSGQAADLGRGLGAEQAVVLRRRGQRQPVGDHPLRRQATTLQGIGRPVRGDALRAGGMLLNDTLLSYRVPAIRDIPAAMKCSIVENGDGPSPFGTKGCGVGALAAIPAVVINTRWPQACR